MSLSDLLGPADRAALDVEPLERAETIPSRWYTAPPFFEIDRRVLIDASWQFAGHVSQLAAPGDYLNVLVGSEPVVVVRGDDGRLRAFFNVCRHRGGPLVTDRCGHTTMLQCKYHGWTYRLDGSLRGVPRFNRVDLFEKRDYGLVEIEVQVWEGLIFVRLRTGEHSVEHLLAGIRERIAPIDLSAMQFYRHVPYEVRCNWKVYVDNYLEGYHLPFVHPELCDALDYSAYETELFPAYSLQTSPIDDGDTPYGGGGGMAYYYYVFPNIMLNVLPGRLQTNVVLPLASDRTLVLFDYYYTDVETEEAVRRIEADIAFSDLVQQEDIEICEHVHRGLQSRAFDRGRFSVESEPGVYHFQSMLKEAYRSALCS